MGHRGDRRVGFVDRMQYLVAQESVDEFVNTVVEGRGEHQPLAAGRCGRQDPGDAGKEAEIGHVVGFVDDSDLNRVEAEQALPHQVLEPARAGHHDVDAGLQCGHLAALRYTAEDRGHAQVVGGGQRFESRGDLGGELTGRGQHQARRQ